MKKFDWEDFRNYNIAVHCKTERECNNFLEMAKEHEIVLSDSNRLSERNFFRENGNNICYRVEFKKCLRYDISVYYKAEGFTILEWSDYMEFSKEDLKVGMLVETNHGRALVMPFKYGYVLAYQSGGFDKWNNVKLEEINKVWDVCNIQEGVLDFNEALRPLLYERLQSKEMTVEEISKALGYDIKIVKQKGNSNAD